MFTFLYETIFPALGNFFGALVKFTNMDVYTFIHYYLRPTEIHWGYDNLFTGEYVRMVSTATENFGTSLIWWGKQLLADVLEGIATNLNAIDLPLWVFGLLFGITYWLVIRIAVSLLRG